MVSMQMIILYEKRQRFLAEKMLTKVKNVILHE